MTEVCAVTGVCCVAMCHDGSVCHLVTGMCVVLQCVMTEVCVVFQTPTIAVIGSGGGFRAMTGYSGVFKALASTGLLDCATYACGLSGSSW